jgi:hypothetical protein
MENSIKTQVQEILVENGLDFKIEKQGLYRIKDIDLILNLENGALRGTDFEPIATPYFGLVNTKSGNTINSVKDGYTVSQNHEILNLALLGMQKFGDKLSISKAGSLNDGRKVFIQLKIEGKKKIGNDTLTQYVTIIDSNDGSTSLSIGIGDKCARCLNEFFKFYKAGNAKFRHTATLEQKLRTIPMLIETALAENLRQVRLYEMFESTPITRELANGMVKAMLGHDRELTSMDVQATKSSRSINIMDALYNDIDTEFNQVGLNLWGLFGGATRFTTHTQVAPKRENGRAESLLNGSSYKLNQSALEFCESQLTPTQIAYVNTGRN